MKNQHIILSELKRCIKTGKYAHMTFEEKFWKQVDKSNNCWEFNKKIYSNGYGCFRINGLDVLAHHVSYLLCKGFILDNMVIMHTCDNRKCVNPNHLIMGTYSDNIQDMYRKNRQNVVSGERNWRYRITDNQIAEIIKMKKDGFLHRDIAKKYNISQPQVSRIVNGKRRSLER